MRVPPVLLLLILLAMPPLASGGPVAASVAPVQLTLSAHVDFLEDPRHVLSLEDMRRPGHRWMPNGYSAFNRGFNDSSFWLRMRLVNPAPNSQPRLLEIGYAALDHIQV